MFLRQEEKARKGAPPALIVMALRKNRVDSPQDVFTNIYAVCFMAAIPALAGARGVHVAKRLLSRPDVTEITRQRLNELFLSVVIFAYVALAFIMVILERLNRR